jgi:uncharacterized membrane protein YbjE (DUF340 family)
MPYGSWVNNLPTAFFLVVHIAAFALGAGFGWLVFVAAVYSTVHKPALGATGA